LNSTLSFGSMSLISSSSTSSNLYLLSPLRLTVSGPVANSPVLVTIRTAKAASVSAGTYLHCTEPNGVSILRSIPRTGGGSPGLDQAGLMFFGKWSGLSLI
jgi:hypothetical protein